MAISTEAEKAFEKFQYPFMINTLQNMSKEGTYLNIIKAIYDKPRANILNGEKVKAFLLRSRTRQGCPLLPLLFSIVLEVLAMAITGKKEIELPVFANDMILYTEHSKDATRKLPELINNLVKSRDTKLIHRKIPCIPIHEQQKVRKRN